MAKKQTAAKSAKKTTPAKTEQTKTTKQKSALVGMVQPQSFDNAIKMYLDNRASIDPQFAKKYNGSGKTVAGCIKWIYGELAKMVKREGNFAAMATNPEEIYAAAVHYFDEDSIKECTTMPAGVAVQASVSPTATQSVAPTKPVPVPEPEDEDLFASLDEDDDSDDLFAED